MPKYKASLIIKADNGARLETMTIIIVNRPGFVGGLLV